MWAPKDGWVYLAVAIFAVTIGMSISAGHDPARTLIAVLGGAIGGGLGGVASHFVERAPMKHKKLAEVLPVAGSLVGAAISMSVSKGLEGIINRNLAYMVFVGATVGALVGLIPKNMLKRTAVNLGNWSFWICIGAGAFGGAILAAPTAIILTVVGRRRGQAKARLKHMTIVQPGVMHTLASSEPRIYIFRDAQYGPYPPEYFEKLLSQGLIAPTDWVCMHGDAKWMPVEAFVKRLKIRADGSLIAASTAVPLVPTNAEKVECTDASSLNNTDAQEAQGGGVPLSPT